MTIRSGSSDKSLPVATLVTQISKQVEIYGVTRESSEAPDKGKTYVKEAKKASKRANKHTQWEQLANCCVDEADTGDSCSSIAAFLKAFMEVHTKYRTLLEQASKVVAATKSSTEASRSYTPSPWPG